MTEPACHNQQLPADAPGAAPAVIDVDHVGFAYDGTPVLEDVSLRVAERDFVCIIGPNGGGKTTLLKIILGLLLPQSGSVRVFGETPRAACRRIGYMPQRSQLDPQFPVTVREVVLMGRLRGLSPFGPFGRADRALALDALREVNLADLANRPFAALSGGQRQRVLIARALACRPDVLLLDEPTANLDPLGQDDLHDLLLRLNERLTIAIVSHDVGFVSQHVKSVVCVNRRVVSHTAEHISGENIRDIYGHDVHVVHHDHSHDGGAHSGAAHDHAHGGHDPSHRH